VAVATVAVEIDELKNAESSDLYHLYGRRLYWVLQLCYCNYAQVKTVVYSFSHHADGMCTRLPPFPFEPCICFTAKEYSDHLYTCSSSEI
jgi:hypothetical protein